MTAQVEQGDRVRLIRCSDDWTDLRPGALGTVAYVDDLKTVHVDWDNGSVLGLIDGEDEFEVLYSSEPEDA